MIDIKDLQIGNKILYKDKIVEVATIHVTGTIGILNGCKDFIFSVSCKDIEPIEVSVGVLLMNACFKTNLLCVEFYKTVNDCFVEVRKDISNSINRNWFCHIDNLSHSTIGGFDFQYLHELQNGIRLITKGDLEVCL